MQFLLRLSGGIDWLTEKIGNAIIWLVLAAALISAGNSVLRKAFNIGSNAWLEMQWYLFAAVFLLGAGYTFLHNGHVRIDFLSSRLSARTRNVIDIVGIAAVQSSTSVALAIMGERGLLRTAGGRSALSVSLFQDIMVIPILLLVAWVAPPGHSEGAAFSPLAAAGLIVGMVVLARFAMRPLLLFIANTGLREVLHPHAAQQPVPFEIKQVSQ